MHRINSIIILFVGLVFIGCEPKKTSNQTEESEVAKDILPTNLQNVFDAHGGLALWSEMQALSYTMSKGETHQVSLWDRKVRIEGEGKTIGFDGEQVWVLPDTTTVRNGRFYHNLYFYFFAMPFVLGDPGIDYEEVPAKDFLGKSYSGIKVSYDNGVGDAPEDNYILCYDPISFEMAWLMYTVTYSSGAPSDDYHLIRYPEWKSFAGLKLPTKLQWHTYQGDSVGAVRSEQFFTDVSVSKEPLPDALFTMPAGAQVAPLK